MTDPASLPPDTENRERIARALWEFDGYMEPWHESERSLYFEKADAVLAAFAAGRAAAHPDPPECRAPHCWSEYGTPCGDCPTLASARKDAGSASNPGDGDHAASPDERDGER